MANELRLNLTVILEPGSAPQAARETLVRLTQDEWNLLLEYSLAVVCLEEARVTEREYWVAPRAV